MAVQHRAIRAEAGPVLSRVTVWGPLLGVVLAMAMNLLASFGYVRFNFYTGFTDHFNTIGVVFILFLLCWPLAGMAGKLLRRRLTPADRAIVYFCLMLATVVPTMGLCGYLLPLVSGVTYYATAENGWQGLIVENLSPWTITTPGTAVTWFYEGLPPGETPPLVAWQAPLLFWGGFFLVLSVVSVALMVLMRRQWQDHERLTYPLTALPLELIGAAPPRAHPLFRNPLLWIGAAVAFGVTFYNAAAVLIGNALMMTLPEATFSTGFELFRKTVGVHIRFDPLVVGLSYLVTLDVLLSVWVFYWLATVQRGVLGILGISRPAGPHAAGGGILAPQQTGALLFLAGLALYNARLHLRGTLRGEVDDSREILSYRASWALLVGGSLVLWYMLVLTGLSGPIAAFVLLSALALFFSTSQILAQTGIGRLRAPTNPAVMLQDLLGTARLTRSQLSALGFSFIWAGDIQLFTMGTAAMGLQAMYRTQPERPRIALPTGMVAVAAALVTALLGYLLFAYRYGAHSGYGWYWGASPVVHWGYIANSIRGGDTASLAAWLLTGLGGLLALVMDFLHRSYSWWPLHPVGLAISQINTVMIDWFSMFLAWLIKVMVLHYGGAGLYRGSLPVFLGLVLGSVTGVSLTFVVRLLTA